MYDEPSDTPAVVVRKRIFVIVHTLHVLLEFLIV
jgi:hypothetical protein